LIADRLDSPFVGNASSPQISALFGPSGTVPQVPGRLRSS
jgi:hypothetical protein